MHKTSKIFFLHILLTNKRNVGKNMKIYSINSNLNFQNRIRIIKPDSYNDWSNDMSNESTVIRELVSNPDGLKGITSSAGGVSLGSVGATLFVVPQYVPIELGIPVGTTAILRGYSISDNGLNKINKAKDEIANDEYIPD